MKLNEKLTQDLREQIGNLSSLNTADKSSVVNAINEVNNKIIYDNTLTSSQSSITVDNLDIVRDGGIYEAIIIAYSDVTDEMMVQFNNQTDDGYYRSIIGINGTSPSQMQSSDNYSQALTRVEGYLKLVNQPFPSIFKMKIIFSNKKISFFGEYTQQFYNGHSYVKMGGIYAPDQTNLNSIKYGIRGNVNGHFISGTRVIIRKVL